MKNLTILVPIFFALTIIVFTMAIVLVKSAIGGTKVPEGKRVVGNFLTKFFKLQKQR